LVAFGFGLALSFGVQFSAILYRCGPLTLGQCGVEFSDQASPFIFNGGRRDLIRGWWSRMVAGMRVGFVSVLPNEKSHDGDSEDGGYDQQFAGCTLAGHLRQIHDDGVARKYEIFPRSDESQPYVSEVDLISRSEFYFAVLISVDAYTVLAAQVDDSVLAVFLDQARVLA
jgi:hypothetical protein